MEDEIPSSRHGQILIALFTAGAIALIAATGWYYLRQRAAREAMVTQGLRAIAEIKAKQIANWRGERLGDGRVLTSSAILHVAKRVLASRVPEAADRADLLDVMQKLEREFLYTGAALVDREGTIRLELNIAADPARIGELGKAAAQASDVSLQDLYWDAKLGRPLMALSVPVEGMGAFLFSIDPERFLYPFIKLWPVPSATAETVLVRREGNRTVYLSDLRDKPGSGFHFWRPVRVPRRTEAQTKSGWAFKQLDYRGVTVEGTVVPVPNSPWYLIAKIDASEVDAPVSHLGWEMAWIMALIALANATGAGFIWRSRQMRIYQERAILKSRETEALRKSEERLRLATAYGKLGIWEWQIDADRLIWSEGLLAIFDWPNEGEELTLERFFSAVHPDDRDRVEAAIRAALAKHGDYDTEYRICLRDGSLRWVAAYGRAQYGLAGEPVRMLGAARDITQRKQTEQRLRELNAALARELEERARTEEHIQALSARLMSAQEEERSRLARELHDDLSQQIAALSMAVSNLRAGVPSEFAEVRSQSERIREKLADLGEGVRRMSHELHPAILQYSGLDSALRAYCCEFAALAGIQVAFHSEGSFADVSPALALCAYRVMQEALQNVVKHARTDKANVTVTRSGRTVKLIISDNGIGMDLNTTRAGCGGLGLTSIRERARLVNGTVEIQSGIGRGTTLILTMPIET